MGSRFVNTEMDMQGGSVDTLLEQVEILKRKKVNIKRNIENLKYDKKMKHEQLQEKTRVRVEKERELAMLCSEVNSSLGRIQILQDMFTKGRRAGQQIQVRSENHVATIKNEEERRIHILDQFTAALYSSLKPIEMSLTMTAGDGDRDSASKLKAIKQKLDDKLKSNAELFELQQQELGPQEILNMLEQQFVDLQAIHADLQIEVQSLGLSQANDLPMAKESESCLEEADCNLQNTINDKNAERNIQESNMNRYIQDSDMDRDIQDSNMNRDIQDSNMDRNIQDSNMNRDIQDSNMDRNIQDSNMDRNLQDSHLDNNMDRNLQEEIPDDQVNGNYMSYEYNMNVGVGYNNNTEFYEDNHNQEIGEGADVDREDVFYEESGVGNDDHGEMEDYSRIEDAGSMEQYYAPEAGEERVLMEC